MRRNASSTKPRSTGLYFSRRETGDLAKAWALVTAAFALLLGAQTPTSVIAVGVIVGGAVIFHEIAHKYVAQRYGYQARFVSNDGMLLAGVGMALFGFIFLAPGAVHTRGQLNPRHQAFIAWAGPAVNAVLAVAGYALIGITGLHGYFGLLFRINALLGAFNMLPVPGFDGQKIWAGDKTLYVATAVVLGVLTVASFTAV